MATLAARVIAAIKAAGVNIVGVSIGDDNNKATWLVQPSNLQSAAQPIIDAFVIAESPAMPAVVPGMYLGVFNVDPEAATDGDLWIRRESFPVQTRVLRFRDGDVTRTLLTVAV